jgi:hypothetical protein
MLDATELNRYTPPMTHELQDAVSLELARRVAARLRESPALLDIPRANLSRWSRQNANSPSLLRSYAEWQGILARSIDEICDLLCAETGDAQRLRQNSPFAGILSPAEVWAIKNEFRRHAAPPA